MWGPGTAFEDIEEAEAMEATLLGHYHGVAHTLEENPGEYLPLLEMDERDGAVVWKPWILGFVRAVRLRPAAWARIESTDDLDVQETLLVIQRLYEAANGTSGLEPEGLDLLDNLAPMLIGGVVRDLNAEKPWGDRGASERLMPRTTHVTVEKAARESLCGCGSERPYTRCCGSH